jgi:hypothetical protein
MPAPSPPPCASCGRAIGSSNSTTVGRVHHMALVRDRESGKLDPSFLKRRVWPYLWVDSTMIVGVWIRRRRIARRKRSFDRLVKSGFPDLSVLFWRVLMPLRLGWCHGAPDSARASAGLPLAVGCYKPQPRGIHGDDPVRKPTLGVCLIRAIFDRPDPTRERPHCGPIGLRLSQRSKAGSFRRSLSSAASVSASARSHCSLGAFGAVGQGARILVDAGGEWADDASCARVRCGSEGAAEHARKRVVCTTQMARADDRKPPGYGVR